MLPSPPPRPPSLPGHTLWSLPGPVCQHHHDIQRRQEENEVKERVAVCHAFLFVIYHLLTFLLVICNKL